MKVLDALQKISQGNTTDSILKTLIYSDFTSGEFETLAQFSQQLTQQRFGHVMQLFAPLYLSNECVNQCTYCGFSVNNKIPRLTLNLDQVRQECVALQQDGIQHILLVAGEHSKHVGLDYLSQVVSSIKDLFASISIEIAPLEESDYRQLCETGVSGLTVYQETYNRDIYQKIHLKGPKKDFDSRQETLLKGARAGMRLLGLGCLWGLAPWQEDFLELVAHAQRLQKEAWRSQLSFSFPRLRHAEGVMNPEFPLTDRDLVKMICLLRLIFPEAQLSLSTRETPQFRQHLSQLGITVMSAGSKTNPGAYSLHEDSLEQFSIHDTRSIAEVQKDLQEQGFDVTSKDWDKDFHGVLTK